MNGTCKYGNEKCWFKHNDNKDKNENEGTENIVNENNEVVQRIFKMLEKMTGRIF